MAERRDILWRFLGDAKSLNKASKSANKGLGTVQKGMSTAAKAAGALGLALGAREIVGFAGDAIQMGIAADEIDSKFQAVYGSAEELTQSLKDWGDVAGVTTTEAKGLAATFGNLAMAQGIGAEETESLAMQVATLAGDMASFNDSDPSLVFEDLNKAILTTEREGLKKYGIAVTESEVKTKALAIAVADGRSEITQADRSLASYQIVVQQAGKAVGDLERTEDSLANKQRQLTASVKEMQEAFGRELVKSLAKATKSIDTTEMHLEDLGSTAGRLVAGAIEPLIGNLDDVATASDSSVAAVDRLTAAWRAGYEEATGYVPPLALLDRTMNTLRGTTERMTGSATRLTAAFNMFPYLEFQAGMNGMADAAGRLATKIASIPSLADLEAPTSARPGGGGGTPVMASGGVVPGRRGTPQLITAHGGERIDGMGSDSGGGGVNITVNMGVVGDPDSAAQAIADLMTRYETTAGTRRSGIV